MSLGLYYLREAIKRRGIYHEEDITISDHDYDEQRCCCR